MASPRRKLIGRLVIAGAVYGLALATVQPTASQAASGAESIRVMTWNIHHAEAPDSPGVTDIGRIANVIRAENADLVTLNEVHDDPPGAGSHGGQPAELTDLLEDAGYRYSQFGVTEEHDEGVAGNLVLSKFPFYTDPADPRSPENTRLSTDNADPTGKPRRALLKVTVRVPGAGDVRVYATHLSTPANAAGVADQQVQVRTILDKVRPTDRPMFVAGDFNIRATDVEGQDFSRNNLMQAWIADTGLVDTWRQVNNGSDGPTLSSAYGNPNDPNPDRRIDFVYASPAFEVVRGRVSLVDRYASDHLAVVMDLNLQRSMRLDHRTVLAGRDGLDGWSQVVTGKAGETSWSVCKNRGTKVDDGTAVRATLRRSNGAVIKKLTNGGTSRDRCTSAAWRGRLPARAELETCLVTSDETLHCRQRRVGSA